MQARHWHYAAEQPGAFADLEAAWVQAALAVVVVVLVASWKTTAVGTTIVVTVFVFSSAIADLLKFVGKQLIQRLPKAAVALNQLHKHNAVAGQVKIACTAYGKVVMAGLVAQTQQKAKHG